MKRMFFLILIFFPAISTAANSSDQIIERSQESISTLNILTICFLLLTIIFGIWSLYSFSVLSNPKYQKKKHLKKKNNLKIQIEDNAGSLLMSIKGTVFDQHGSIITEKVSNSKGFIDFSLDDGEFSLTLTGFGYEPVSVNKFQMMSDKTMILKTKAVEDIKDDLPIYFQKSYVNYLAITLIISGIIIAFYSNQYLSMKQSWFILMSVLVLTILYFFKPRGFQILDSSNNPIKNSLFTLTDSKGNPIRQVKTNQKGMIISLFSKGFYKISKEGLDSRTFKINNKSIPQFKLKF